MGITKTLQDRFEKFTAKTPPDVTGTRYANSKTIALPRFLEGSSAMAVIVELTRNILESSGVPAGQQGVYFAFAQRARRIAFSHSGDTLTKFLEGLKAEFVSKGCDPAILDKIASLITG
ncbi:MAG: hypothetical protein DRJ67_11870 [Thermoprotei archaeon]|nr:MAG: hypothetical protein DRJ67_11870 [Thermoprotei archaeon]